MVKQLADSIASFLVREKFIEKDNADIYRFGMEQILINSSTFLTLAIFASIFDMWLETIFFFVGMMPIRMVAGGYHAKTIRRCNVLSLIVLTLNLWLIQLLGMRSTKEIITIICLMIICIIFCFAPVDHKNRVLKNEDYVKSKQQSRLIALVLVGSCVGMAWFREINQMITISIMMGAFTASVSLVIGSIARGGERSEEFAQKCN